MGPLAARLSIVGEYWVACATAAAALAAAVGGSLGVCTFLLAALVTLMLIAARLLPERLGLGPRARVVVTLGAREIFFAVRNITLDEAVLKATKPYLPLPLVVTAVVAQELGLAFHPWALVYEFRSAGLKVRARMAEPSEWDAKAAQEAGEAAAQVLVDAAFASLLAAEGRDRGPGPPGRLMQLLDAVIGRASMVTEDFSVALQAGSEAAHAQPAQLRLGLSRLELPPAVSIGGDAFAPRWRREVVVSGFMLDSRRPGTVDEESPLLLPPVARSVLRVTAPPLLTGLVFRLPGPRRRIDVDVFVQEQHVVVHLDAAKTGFLLAILYRYWAASKWQQDFVEAALRPARRPSASERAAAVEQLGGNGLAALPQLAGEDQLGIRWWAFRGADALTFDPHDDAAWSREAAALWRSADERCKAQVAEMPLYHELGLRLDVESPDLIIGEGDVHLRSRGVVLSIQLLPNSMDFAVTVAHSVALDVRPPSAEAASPVPSGPHQALLRCGTAVAPFSGAGQDRATFGASVSLPTTGPTVVRLSACGCFLRALPAPALVTLLPAFQGLLVADPVPDSPPGPDSGAQGSAAEPDSGCSESLSALGEDTAPSGGGAAAPPGALLAGAEVELHCELRGSGFLLPAQADAKDLNDGVAVKVARLCARLSSSQAVESLALEMDGAAATVTGGYEVLHPMAPTSINYSSRVCPARGAPLSKVAVRCAFAKVSASPAVLRVGGKAAKLLLSGLEGAGLIGGTEPEEADGEAAKEAEAAQSQAEEERHSRVLAGLRGLFEHKREEVFRLVQSLCTGAYSLTSWELSEAFEDLWAVMDASNDGKVSFAEFCGAIEKVGSSRTGEAGAGQTRGSLALAAADLCCGEAAARVGEEESKLWAQLESEVAMSPVLGGGTNEPPLTLQWKLLRALRNFDAARDWWASTVAAKVAAGAEWAIGGETEFLPAHEVLTAAFAGHLVKTKALVPETGDSKTGADGKQPWGLEVSATVAGFELGLADALAVLRGHGDRLVLGAGDSGDDDVGSDAPLDLGGSARHRMWEVCGEDGWAPLDDGAARLLSDAQRSQVSQFEYTATSGEQYEVRLLDMLQVEQRSGARQQLRQSAFPAIAVSLRLWRADKHGTMPAEADELEATFRLRGLHGSCLSPFQPKPDSFIESWGVRAKVFSAPRDRALTVQLVSDEHFVINVTSSLLLAVKPMVDTLLPSHAPAVAAEQEEMGPRTAPLDHMLSGLGELQRGELLGHGLLAIRSGADEVGLAAVDEEEVDSVSLREGRRAERPHGGRVAFLTQCCVSQCCVADPQLDADARGSGWSTLVFERSFPSSVALTRIMVPAGWTVEWLRRRGAHLEFGLSAEPSSPSPALEGSRVLVYGRKTCASPRRLSASESEQHLAGEQVTEGLSEAPVRKRELRVVNRCGKSGSLWFERQCGNGREENEPRQALHPGRLVTCIMPPEESKLCLALDGHTEALRLDLSSVGRYAVPLAGHIAGGNCGLCLCAALSIDGQGGTLLELLPPLEIRNATQLPLRVELLPPAEHRSLPSTFAGTEVEKVLLLPGEDLQVPLQALEETGWTVTTTGVVAHAFPLSEPLLRVGQQEAKVRRALGLALETQTLPAAAVVGAAAGSPRPTSSGSTSQLRRRTLLLLPGLRISNALPLALRVALEAYGAGAGCATGPHPQPDTREVQPGTAIDFGLSTEGFRIALSTHNAALYALEVPPEARQERRKFLDLARDLDLGNLRCRLNCVWAARTGPELVVCAPYVMLNKTGLPLCVRDSLGGVGQAFTPEEPAVLRAERHQVEVKVLEQDAAAVELPSHEGALRLQLHSEGQGPVLDWHNVHGVLASGVLTFKREEEVLVAWELSHHSMVSTVELYLAGGEEHVFRIDEPALQQAPPLQAPSSQELLEWLRKLRGTVTALRTRKSADVLRAGWNSEEHGTCHLAVVPQAVRGSWSNEVPVRAADAGELTLQARGRGSPAYLFLGVQVRPLVGMLARSTGVTFTPRFIVQNRSEVFIHLLPGLLSPNESEWQAPRQAAVASSGLDLPTSQEAAIWVPPGDSAALFHFPLWCSAREGSQGRKAVALHLAGSMPLELTTAQDHRCLPLEQVLTRFMPYRDEFFQFGPLPQSLRTLVREERLQCLRGLWRKRDRFEEMELNVEVELFITVPMALPTPPWLANEPWCELRESLELRRSGGSIVTMLRLFRRRAPPGSICLDGLGKGSVVMLARAPLDAAGLRRASSGAGLLWSRWVSLDRTGDAVLALSAQESRGRSKSTHFVRCSVQVELSTAFLVLSAEQPPYRVENRSPSRTLALMFQGSRKHCRVLPPLSWCAFDWPDPTAQRRKIVVHDVNTSRREMYDTDEVGAGSPLDLADGATQATGNTAPLTEEGYKSVLLLLDSAEMADFVRRVVTDLGGRFRDDNSLLAFAKKYTEASRSLRKMRQDLVASGTVPRPRPELTEAGCRAAALCEETMVDFIRALVAAGGLAAADEGELRGYAVRRLAQPNLQRSIEDLAVAPWVRPREPADTAFEAAAARGDQAGIQLCLWRVLQDANASAAGRTVAAAAAELALQDVRATGRPREWKDVATRALACAHRRSSEAGTAAATANGSQSALPAADVPDVRDAMGAVVAGGEGSEDSGGEAGGSSSEAEGSTSAVALSEPLTEEGYQNVVSLGNAEAMVTFVRRVIADEGGEVLQPEMLPIFVGWCTAPSLTALRAELSIQDWVRFGAVGRGRLYADRWHDGVTKVLCLSERRDLCARGPGEGRGLASTRPAGSILRLEWWSVNVQLAGLHFCMIHQPRIHALGTGAERSTFTKEEELFALTADHLLVLKELGKRKVEVRLHHVQIDNLSEADRVHPIVVAPLDSGYHSDRREKSLSQKREQYRKAVSFLYFSFEQLPSSILHIRELQFILKPVVVRIDLVFWIELGKLLLDWLPHGPSSSGEDAAITKRYVKELRTGPLHVPSSPASSKLMYLELLRIGAVISQVEFLMPVKSRLTFKHRKSGTALSDSNEGEEEVQDGALSAHSVWLASFLSRVTFRSQGYLRKVLSTLQHGIMWVMQTIGSGVISGAGHVTPKFSFPETLIMNELCDLDVFLTNLIRTYVKSSLKQWWRVFLSTNLLGDPIGLGTSVTGGLVQFVRKTGSEVYTADFRGEGMALLAQGVVGGTFGHAGKLFGALGDTLDAIAQTGTDGRGREAAVAHVGDGLTAGLRVFVYSTASGVRGLYERPREGFQRGGILGLGKGIVKGLVGMAAKPVSGLMHGVQHLAEGVEATTQLLSNWQQIKPRREPRALGPGLQLSPLNPAVFSPKITIFVESFETDSRQLRGATYKVKLIAYGSSGSQVWSKATKLGRLSRTGVVFQEAKWFPSHHLLGHELGVEVQDLALGPDPRFPEVVYRARLAGDPNPQAPLARVAALVQHPITDHRLRRLRPAEPLRLPLEPVGSPCTGEKAELLLSFFPAWDPETVPQTQRWVEASRTQRRSMLNLAGPALEELPRRQGWLEKRSQGAFHHWSAKWVVVGDRELRYWNDKRKFDDGREPKARMRLADKDCPFRFAAGAASEVRSHIFLQVQTGGQLEARWRAPTSENATDWLQAILWNSIAA